MTNEERLAELLLRWEDAWEQGEELSPEALCDGSTELVAPLQQRIEALKSMAWMDREFSVFNDTDSDRSSHSKELEAGTLLADRYQIKQTIGKGGFGYVYRAFDRELQRDVAVKISHRHGSDDKILEEARRVAQLRHPGIVAIHDVGKYDDRCFFVADLIEGTNLAEVMSVKRLTLDETVRLMATVARSLHAAHQQGFVHRDIKPANILIDKQGQPFLTDFGIATTAHELSEGDATSGTLPYMAPEQVSGETQMIHTRTDIYALGVVLYELLTGRLPYPGRTSMALREQILFQQPRPFDNKIPSELGGLCLSCLQKHPNNRPATALEIAESLQDFLGSQKRGRIPIFVMLLGIAITATILAWGINYFPNNPSQSQAAESMSSSQTIAKDGVFHFDGETRIITPLLSSTPITLEAWVFPERYFDACQFFIGSDIPSKYGLGIGIGGPVLSAQYVSGMINTKQAVPLRIWSHVAVVFDKEETRLYFNGKLVHTAPATNPPHKAPFVIGNVGQDNPLDYFCGKIRCLRITDGARYQSNFTPQEQFEPDSSKTLLIYDGDHTDGDKILDLSLHHNHGHVDQLPTTMLHSR